MYKVIRKFKDADGALYEIGEAYPAKGVKKPTNARIKTLSSSDNKYGQIYIVKDTSEKG